MSSSVKAGCGLIELKFLFFHLCSKVLKISRRKFQRRKKISGVGHVGPFEVGHVGPGGYKSLLLSVTRLIFIEIMKLFFLVISRTVSFAMKMIRDILL